MAIHVTDKDLKDIVGDLNNLDLPDGIEKNIVSILNELLRRTSNSSNSNEVDTLFTITDEGINLW